MDSPPDLLTFDGAAVKRLPDDPETGALRAAGYLVVFSGEDDPDLAGDYFTKSRNVGVVAEGGALPPRLDDVFEDGWSSPYSKALVSDGSGARPSSTGPAPP